MKHTAMKAFHPFAFAFAFAFILLSQSGPALAEHKPAASIPTADLMQPADLAANLKSGSAPKPLILHVGFRKLYTQAHIPESQYVGEADQRHRDRHLLRLLSLERLPKHRRCL